MNESDQINYYDYLTHFLLTILIKIISELMVSLLNFSKDE